MSFSLRKALNRLGFDLIRYRQTVSETQSVHGRIVPANIDGRPVKFFVVNPADEIQRFHRQGKFYEQEGLDLIASEFTGGTFLDVGANVGNHALYVAMFLNAGRVIAVEPAPAAYMILQVNVGLNGLGSEVFHKAVGLSNQEGSAKICTPDGDLGSSSLLLGDGPVRVTTGDRLLDGRRADFIKIDVEGAEIEVLEGLQETIERFRPKLFVEVADSNYERFTKFTNSYGYVVGKTTTQYLGLTNFLMVPPPVPVTAAVRSVARTF